MKTLKLCKRSCVGTKITAGWIHIFLLGQWVQTLWPRFPHRPTAPQFSEAPMHGTRLKTIRSSLGVMEQLSVLCLDIRFLHATESSRVHLTCSRRAAHTGAVRSCSVIDLARLRAWTRGATRATGLIIESSKLYGQSCVGVNVYRFYTCMLLCVGFCTDIQTNKGEIFVFLYITSIRFVPTCETCDLAKRRQFATERLYQFPQLGEIHRCIGT